MIVKDSAVMLKSYQSTSVSFEQKEALHYWNRQKDLKASSETSVVDTDDLANSDSYVRSEMRQRSAESYKNIVASMGNSSGTKNAGNEFIEKLKEGLDKIIEESKKMYPDTKTEKNGEDEYVVDDKTTHNARIVKIILEALTGKTVNIDVPKLKQKDNAGDIAENTALDSTTGNQEVLSREENSGWGAEYSYSESYSKTEEYNFSASGSIETDTGEKIEFSFDLTVSHTEAYSQGITVKSGEALTDPLAINLNGNMELSDKTFSFDLNSDGNGEQISFLSNGGYLVVDKNGNGIIDNGSELFGPETNDGFEELKSYDGDNNGWIDMGDSIFGKLFLFTKDENGNEIMRSMDESNIGALYTGYSNGGFQRGNNGETDGVGVYLKNKGGAGTLEHINLLAK